jgi:hypothetical protein
MAAHSHHPSDGTSNVVLFPRRRLPWDEDYPHRMAVYGGVLLAIACLVAGGVWLASALNRVPVHVDCNFSKYRPCKNYPDNPPRIVALPR